MKGSLIILFVFNLLHAFSSDEAASINQTIRGQVIDKVSHMSLPGATVIAYSGSTQKGASTDANGYFVIEGVETGRITLQATFVGYSPVTLSNLSITSAKELILTIEMEEMVEKLDEVTVTANRKAETLNKMANISARTFSVEESQRFAGARNDVSRMATNFAGVSTANDAVNDIVIRGNSPNGLLWKMEGVDIPNPNHFGMMGTTGGPVSMLNNNLLSNSDFITSAFPAEYGNAVSGVFDLKMRNGNYEKHEFLGQIGFNGFELGAEGPLNRKTNASYLINARLSTLEVMKKMGMEFGTGAATPEYKDLSFKVNYPTKKAGTFSLFGLGGSNRISFINSEIDTTEENQNFYGPSWLDIYSENSMAIGGLSHNFIFSNNMYIRTVVGVSSSRNKNHLDSVDYLSKNTTPFSDMVFDENRLFANMILNKKINARNSFRLGSDIKQIGFDLNNYSYDPVASGIKTTIDFQDEGFTHLFQAFFQWQYKLTDNLVLSPGIHYQYLGLNGHDVLEPRFSAKWSLDASQSLSVGYGFHSQMLPIYYYFTRATIDSSSYLQPNKDLDFTQSHHYVVGYDRKLSSTVRFKAEVYYQDIVKSTVNLYPSSYSVLNNASFSYYDVPTYMKNGGGGYNYGLELTLERFLDKGLYYLLTTSLFESKYKGSDGIWRNTAFNGNYVTNILAGKEFELKTRKESRKQYLLFDAKASFAGGQHYTPMNLAESRIESKVVYDNTRAYELQFKDYFRSDIRVAFRMDGKNVSQEWAFDIQNVTNQQNPLMVDYDVNTGEEVIINQLGIFPMMQYRIVF